MPTRPRATARWQKVGDWGSSPGSASMSTADIAISAVLLVDHHSTSSTDAARLTCTAADVGPKDDLYL